jgi:hypothetical protein
MNHREAAERWMKDHPLAMDVYRRLALTALARGHRIGIAMLTERIRWEFIVSRNTMEEFKIPNNHRAYIARQLIREIPGLDKILTIHRTMDES